MPNGVQLPIPFPERISPDFERAESVHLEWPRSFGLICTEKAAQRHARARFVELAARFHPTAQGRDLDLAVDQLSWFFIYDDTFDALPGQDPDQARKYNDALIELLDPTVVPPSEPILAAFADMWKRTCEGMSAAWRARASDSWRVLMNGFLAEVIHRRSGTILTSDEYMQLRRDSIGVHPILDLAERVGHFEVPEAAFKSDHLTAMRALARDAVIFHNDICSVEKEESWGDPHNLVLILEREQRCSRPAVIELMREMVRERLERFCGLEASLVSLYESLELNDRERESVRRYVHDALRAVVRGDYDWAERSGRYAASEAKGAPAVPDSENQREVGQVLI